jgi:hypothetical protein
MRMQALDLSWDGGRESEIFEPGEEVCSKDAQPNVVF